MSDTSDPNQYCRQKAAQSGSSFYYSFLFLEPKKRQALMALYAFCREVDDIVDEIAEKSIAEQKLSWWEREIERVFDKQAQHPIGQALTEAINNYPLPKVLFQEILEGMRMDLNYQGYQKFEDLKLYCHCVASAVGLLSIEVFGYQNPNTQVFARKLGLSLQLINIIRDVGEDALKARIYLPTEDLERFNVPDQQILSRTMSKGLQDCLVFQAARARDFFQEALAVLDPKDRHAQLPSLIMAEIYLKLLQEIEKRQFAVLHQSIRLTPLRKLYIAWCVYRRERKRQADLK